MIRVPGIAAALILFPTASILANAQQWGGSPPAHAAVGNRALLMPRAAATVVVPGGAFTLTPAPQVYFGEPSNRARTGGSWSGAQPTWGGGTPPAPVSRRPVYYVPTPVFAAPVGARAVAVREAGSAVRLRESYLRRRGQR